MLYDSIEKREQSTEADVTDRSLPKTERALVPQCLRDLSSSYTNIGTNSATAWSYPCSCGGYRTNAQVCPMRLHISIAHGDVGEMSTSNRIVHSKSLSGGSALTAKGPKS
jgi:hypothetical protein